MSFICRRGKLAVLAVNGVEAEARAPPECCLALLHQRYPPVQYACRRSCVPLDKAKEVI